MWYKLAADLLVLIHFGFIIFVVLGGLLVLRWPWVGLLHSPAAAWGAWIEISHGLCPLTTLEQSLRRAANTPNYEGGFIANYIVPMVYPPGFSPEMARLLGITLLAGTLVIYLVVISRRFRNHTKFPPR